jgi:hypothetical protein
MAERSLQVVERTDRPMAVAQPGPRLGLPTPSELEALKAYGQLAIASGMAPKHIDKWETAVVIMRYAHQLGVDEFTGLQNMWVIGGKPSMMASLQHALILRDHGDDAIHVRVSNADTCELVCKRRTASQPSLVKYTMAEAVAANLPTTNGTWKKYPADMLFARAISRAGRQIFRDTTMGLYVPEEIGGTVIEAHGEIIEAPDLAGPQAIHEVTGGYAAVLSGKATKEQLQEIAALGESLGLDKAGIRARLGKEGKHLTGEEAQKAIYAFKLDAQGQPVTEPDDDYEDDEDLDALAAQSTLGNMPADTRRYDS